MSDEMFEEKKKQQPILFDVLRARNVARCNGGGFNHTLDGWTEAQYACALAGEVGELCNLIKKRFRAAFETDRIEDKKLADEIADVLIYLDLLSARCGIDLEQALRSKFNEVSRRVNSPYFL